MSKRRLQYEVVPECDHTDFSDRLEGNPSVSNSILIGVGLTAAATTSAAITYGLTNKTVPGYATATITAPTPIIEPTIEPLNVLSQIPPTIPVNFNAMNPEIIPTGFVTDTSLNMLANVLDPLVQILVAISFPIASVIMVGACFFFMLGNSEKAWQTIFNAGLGYVLVQMSPLFLKILQEIGKAV